MIIACQSVELKMAPRHEAFFWGWSLYMHTYVERNSMTDLSLMNGAPDHAESPGIVKATRFLCYRILDGPCLFTEEPVNYDHTCACSGRAGRKVDRRVPHLPTVP